jgi:hypothetical protein
MSMETNVLLRTFYRVLLTSKSLEEAKTWALTMLDEKDAAHVEKIAAREAKDKKEE